MKICGADSPFLKVCGLNDYLVNKVLNMESHERSDSTQHFPTDLKDMGLFPNSGNVEAMLHHGGQVQIFRIGLTVRVIRPPIILAP